MRSRSSSWAAAAGARVAFRSCGVSRAIASSRDTDSVRSSDDDEEEEGGEEEEEEEEGRRRGGAIVEVVGGYAD